MAAIRIEIAMEICKFINFYTNWPYLGKVIGSDSKTLHYNKI